MLSSTSTQMPRLHRDVYAFAVAGLLRLAEACTTLDAHVLERLEDFRGLIDERRGLLSAFRDYLKHPNASDKALLAVSNHFSLSAIEILAVQLAVAAEEDLLIGHVLVHLQDPLAHSRPSLGLLARAYSEAESHNAIYILGQGAAARCGLLQFSGEDLPLPERQARVCLANCLALKGVNAHWPGTSSIDHDQSTVSLGRTAKARARDLGERLCRKDGPRPALIIRSGDPLEARFAAQEVSANCGQTAVLVHSDHLIGMAPWLFLNERLPVFTQRLAPGERKPIPVIPGYDAPLIVLCGLDGDFDSDERHIIEWRLQTPSCEERQELWATKIQDRSLAHRMATQHRHSAGRIAVLASKAREVAGNNNEVTYEHIRSVARRGDATGLGAMAELVDDEVDDAALVASPALREELDSLVVRCRLRDHFSDSLGPSIKARYRPSVRALFLGASGTGKTLAAAWLATRLGMPLYRVDLSAITSKYIGETEKNLSLLLTQAEQNEVVLLFDEADALFGKRTDIQEANDRFANAQTNYLLQRMESYDGITVLTSNGRNRFDAAFSRRFDAIVSFPLPGPEERRSLWCAHLGTRHGVCPAQLNLLSVAADLSGGQIRNAVLRGAVVATQCGEKILYQHLLIGVAQEYRKLSRQLPTELKQASSTNPVGA
jgi:hypothetical protein